MDLKNPTDLDNYNPNKPIFYKDVVAFKLKIKKPPTNSNFKVI
jgi:hypothetical protein